MEARVRRTRSSVVKPTESPPKTSQTPKSSKKPSSRDAFSGVSGNEGTSSAPVFMSPPVFQQASNSLVLQFAPQLPSSVPVNSPSKVSAQPAKKSCSSRFAAFLLRAVFLAVMGIVIIPWLVNLSLVIIREIRTPPLSDEQLAECKRIALSLPNEIYLKTETESMTQNHYVAIREGRAYYKEVETDEQRAAAQLNSWRLLGSDGLPHPGWFYYYWPTTWFPTNFVKPARVVTVTADDDNLNLIGDNSVVYYLKWHNMKWQGHWGLELTLGNGYLGPADFPVLPPNKGIAASNRGSFAEHYTDACGHEFHMDIGVDSMFMLTPDGTEIQYIDPWVPPTFHQRIAMPEQNTFVSESISAAASVIMLIDNTGMIYTGLQDWDIVGNTPPMVYTSRCPSPDAYHYMPEQIWMKQPPAPAGVQFSTKISILQTGQGNDAKELRVAAIANNTRVGYAYKQLLDKQWRFREILDQTLCTREELVNPAADPKRNPFVKDHLRSYAGNTHINGWKISIESYGALHQPSPLVFTHTEEEGLSVRGKLVTMGPWENIEGIIMLENSTLATRASQQVQQEVLQGHDEFPVHLFAGNNALYITPRWEITRPLMRLYWGWGSADKETGNFLMSEGKRWLHWSLISGQDFKWTLDRV